MYHSLLLPELRLLILENDRAGITEFCDVLHPAVTAEVLDGLEPAEVWNVLSNCNLDRRVEIFEFLPAAQQVQLVDTLDPHHLTELLEHMSADDRTDLLSRFDDDHIEVLLRTMAHTERSDIRKLLSYPEHSAGSIMTTEYASLPKEITVKEAIERLRRQAPDRETIYYIYVLDEGRRILGFISLQDLMLAKPNALLSDIMKRNVISVPVTSDQEFVANEIGRYDFLAIPVVDEQNRLVGIVTHDDVHDVLQEEATEDAHRQAAVGLLEESYLASSIRTLIWKRGPWLALLLCASVITAGVLKLFDGVHANWMVWFFPLVLGSGGNSGSQSATLVIRALALGPMSRKEQWQLVRRELLLGAMLGAGLMLIAFLCAFLYVDRTAPGPFVKASVVAVTVFFVVTLGSVNGALLPLLFKRAGMDPALMSNPLIAALSDVIGVILFSSIAMLILHSVS